MRDIIKQTKILSFYQNTVTSSLIESNVILGIKLGIKRFRLYPRDRRAANQNHYKRQYILITKKIRIIVLLSYFLSVKISSYFLKYVIDMSILDVGLDCGKYICTQYCVFYTVIKIVSIMALAYVEKNKILKERKPTT